METVNTSGEYVFRTVLAACVRQIDKDRPFLFVCERAKVTRGQTRRSLITFGVFIIFKSRYSTVSASQNGSTLIVSIEFKRVRCL